MDDFRRIYDYRARAFRAISACISLLSKLPVAPKVKKWDPIRR
jgi:hypothetical protein